VTPTIAEVLRPALRDRPDAPALAAPSGTLTYADLDRLAGAAAGALWQLGVRPGDRVAACLPNDLDIVIAFHGAQRIGAVWAGLNEAWSAAEQHAIAEYVTPAVILAGERWKGGPAGARPSRPPTTCWLPRQPGPGLACGRRPWGSGATARWSRSRRAHSRPVTSAA
jgi:long-chain acyl-CoA synthetase